MNLSPNERIEKFIAQNQIALFIKGTADRPECGFSKTVVDILYLFVPDFGCYNILADQEVREEIKKYSNWPTLPQIYINGEFIGGCDIIKEMLENGELAKLLKIDPPKVPPKLHITEKAENAFKDAMKGESNKIRLEISSRFHNDIFFDEQGLEDFVIDYKEFSLLIDPLSALRANEMTIDFMIDGAAQGFIFNNPNEPAKLKEISPAEVKVWQRENKDFLLIDVRPLEEREIAKIDLAMPLYELSLLKREKLDKNLPIIFHCHFGSRSKREAEKWRFLGFKNVFNLVGGIDAWSRQIDNDVPLY